MVIQNRWEETAKSLYSIYYSDQHASSFDVYLIDNGSSEENVRNLKDFVKSSLLPVKNLFCIPETSISKAWNLFLSLTKDYDYRTKYDNDLVLQGTMVYSSPSARGPLPETLTGANPGAIPSGPPIKGIGQHWLRGKGISQHTAFLQHMEECSKAYEADLVALVPVTPNQNFTTMFQECSRKMWKDLPYLFGGCMMISKKCFDNIGYFDERLTRRIDIEYTHRALNQKFNIGYHPSYGVVHIGVHNSTEGTIVQKQRYEKSLQISEKSPLSGFVGSEWNKALSQIVKAASQNKVLCLE